jgi:hypothetical protein
MSALQKYSFAWVTIGFLVLSIVGHWLFGWFAYVDQQQEHQAAIDVGGYAVEMLRDTFENWQSEFLQLLWQVVGLSILMYVGSPQSKESEDRAEEMLKAIIKKVDPDGAQKTLNAIDKKFPNK